ncbi:MAG: alpha/beta fold hydrolase, partial [Ktedonobacterales bacterium]
PDHWHIFVEKMKHTLMDFPGWSPSDLQAITAPTLLVIGDADFVRPEFAVEMFRLLGGARPDGGMAGIPASQFAVLPATTHFSILKRVDLLLPIVTSFLDAPLPDATHAAGR